MMMKKKRTNSEDIYISIHIVSFFVRLIEKTTTTTMQGEIKYNLMTFLILLSFFSPFFVLKVYLYNGAENLVKLKFLSLSDMTRCRCIWGVCVCVWCTL